MSEGQVVIAIDAMGGENSPYKVLKGAEIFLQNEKSTKIPTTVIGYGQTKKL